MSTVSTVALDLYQQGRRLEDNLRHVEAHELYLQAIGKDPEFALAHLGAAKTAGSGSSFFSHLERAIELADLASEGEKHLIYATAAGFNRDPVAQERHALALLDLHPLDERAHAVLAKLYMERREPERAVEHYQRAIEIDPTFAPPYNELGYLHRYLGDNWAAMRAFETYTELIPDEPNPYDSYGELLMKMGRFEESIEQYQKALERDPGFAASRIGIGVNQIFLEDAAAARETFQELYQRAANDGQRRRGLTWLAYSYIFEGRTDEALRQIERRLQLAKAAGDRAWMAEDLALMGRILLEGGRPDAAARKFEQALSTLEQSDATAEIKQAKRLDQIYWDARIALARGELEAAAAGAAAYARETAGRAVGSDRRAAAELAGRVALAREEWQAAIEHLSRADQESPAVLYLLAKAHRGAGDLPRAREYAGLAGNWNALGESYPFVRAKARALGAELAQPVTAVDS